MEINSNNNKNNNYTQSESQSTTGSRNIHCRICNEQFDNMAKMQIHVMIQHMNTGDIPED